MYKSFAGMDKIEEDASTRPALLPESKCTRCCHSEDIREIEECGHAKPRFPQMYSLPLRIKSFQGDDLKFQHINLYQLAKAGFFNARRNDDAVTCFACGVTLNNWEETDIPRAEHLRWSPVCPVVKDNLFIREVNHIIFRLLKLKDCHS